MVIFDSFQKKIESFHSKTCFNVLKHVLAWNSFDFFFENNFLKIKNPFFGTNCGVEGVYGVVYNILILYLMLFLINKNIIYVDQLYLYAYITF